MTARTLEERRAWADAGRAVLAERAATRRAALIEDASWLADTGESLEGAVHRLGYTAVASLARRLERLDRHDILRRLTANTTPWEAAS